jgi:hypothetical protein
MNYGSWWLIEVERAHRQPMFLYTMGFPVCYTSQKAREMDGGDVSRCTSRPAQARTLSH